MEDFQELPVLPPIENTEAGLFDRHVNSKSTPIEEIH